MSAVQPTGLTGDLVVCSLGARARGSTMIKTDLLLLVRLLVAGLLSAIVGWERERARKAAGLRTHMIVGIGSALFIVVALAVAAEPHGGAGEGVTIDPTRTIHAIATGVGFLGAGVVFVRDDSHARGLTTAATIWATAAIGVAAGLGRYVLAAGATLMLLIVLQTLITVERDISGKHPPDPKA